MTPTELCPLTGTPCVASLIGGPQDGACVRTCSNQDPLPIYLHLGPCWLGDGYAAWSQEPSQRFPARYVYDGQRAWRFAGWQTEPETAVPFPEPQGG